MSECVTLLLPLASADEPVGEQEEPEHEIPAGDDDPGEEDEHERGRDEECPAERLVAGSGELPDSSGAAGERHGCFDDDVVAGHCCPLCGVSGG